MFLEYSLREFATKKLSLGVMKSVNFNILFILKIKSCHSQET